MIELSVDSFILKLKALNIDNESIILTNIFKQLRLKKNENIYPTGFILNLKEIFISTSNGKLIIADIKSGNIKDILKIDNELISRPFVHNKNMYLIKDDSIIKLN